MHKPKKLVFETFDSDSSVLKTLHQSTQVQYLYSYLSELNAAVTVEEPNYFDRDYLDEFSAFYSLSSRGYKNICRRVHFFSSDQVSRELVKRAAGSDSEAVDILQNSYLGFCVVRPIPAAPLGRTVLIWFPDQAPEMPRIVSPSRIYDVHLAGITLHVEGLAWQQQDSGVGACATVGVWSTLHSSAFDDHHAVPTTAEITRAAHDGASLGGRVFPSTGLNMYQVMEAIKAQKLAPIWFAGDIQNWDSKGIQGFSTERFSSTCASFIRSGYPVLIWGQHLDPQAAQKHVICAVGFREPPPPDLEIGAYSLQDAGSSHLYIHDDNLGPGVRFKIVDNGFGADGRPVPVTIVTDPPDSVGESPTTGYPVIRPEALCIAVHECLRISPDVLHENGKNLTSKLCKALNLILASNGVPGVSLSCSTRFIKLADYIGEEIGRTLHGRPDLLGDVRMALCEEAPPMSLHLGVIRVALSNSTPLIDLIFDTTDTDRNCPIFAHIIYDDVMAKIMVGLAGVGVAIKAF